MNILVVGSSVIDLFLEVEQKHVAIEGKKVILGLGDKIPAKIRKLALGGNGANVSVALTRLEVPTTFYTYLGGDILAREIQDGLTKEGVELIPNSDAGLSSSLSIIFDFNSDRIIFSHHEKREHSFNFDKTHFDFIYLTSIGQVWEKAYEQTLDFAKTHKIPLAFSPGTRQIENKNETVKEIIGNTKIFFSNLQEAKAVLGKEKEEIEIRDLLKALKELGPSIVSVTDGGQGSYAIDEKASMFSIKPLPLDASERTGAGDAYAGAFFAALINGNNVQKAMTWGTLNANGAMREVGAQNGLLTRKGLDLKLKENNNLMAEQI